MDKNSILSVSDIKIDKVHVPQWGFDVYVKSISALDMSRVYQSSQSKDVSHFAVLCVACLCDEAGNLLFTLDDIPALSQKNGAALETISTAALTLSKCEPQSIEEAKKN